MIFNLGEEMNTYKTSQRKSIMDYLIDNKDKFVNAEEVLEIICVHQGLTRKVEATFRHFKAAR